MMPAGLTVSNATISGEPRDTRAKRSARTLQGGAGARMPASSAEQHGAHPPR